MTPAQLELMEKLGQKKKKRIWPYVVGGGLAAAGGAMGGRAIARAAMKGGMKIPKSPSADMDRVMRSVRSSISQAGQIPKEYQSEIMKTQLRLNKALGVKDSPLKLG